MQLIARMLKGAALAMAVPVIAYGGTPSDATEINGLGNYTLGMTLREFQALSLKAAKTDKADKYFCFKGDYETQCIINDLGQHGPPLSSVSFQFSQTAENQKEQDRRLAAIVVNHYKSTAFDNIEPLFVAKYGLPDKSEVQEIESVTGVKYQSREERWIRDSRVVSLSERGGAGKVDRMSIVILTREYSSFVEKMKEEKLKNDGKRL